LCENGEVKKLILTRWSSSGHDKGIHDNEFAGRLDFNQHGKLLLRYPARKSKALSNKHINAYSGQGLELQDGFLAEALKPVIPIIQRSYYVQMSLTDQHARLGTLPDPSLFTCRRDAARFPAKNGGGPTVSPRRVIKRELGG